SLCPRAEPRRRPGAWLRTTRAGAAPTKARNCRAPAAGLKDLFSGPASGLLRHQDASRVAPLGEQGARSYDICLFLGQGLCTYSDRSPAARRIVVSSEASSVTKSSCSSHIG